jgi:hypothetical protein
VAISFLQRAFPEYTNLTNKRMMWALRIGALKACSSSWNVLFLHPGGAGKEEADGVRKIWMCRLVVGWMWQGTILGRRCRALVAIRRQKLTSC